jgi:hypothetical protein
MARGWSLVAALCATWLVAGCGILTGGGSVGVTSSSCRNMASGACDEQVAAVAARHPGATSIDLVCTVPTCDRRGGRGTATVTLGDGSRVNDAFAYAGNAVPLPAPVCTALAPDLCRRIAEESANDLAPAAVVTRIEVTCALGACTPQGGQVEVRLTLADGSVSELGHAWEGAP